MLSKEQNDAVTITGPGTPGGELLRRYWQPVALSTELPPGGEPVPVGLLGEELVLYRDRDGEAVLERRNRSYPVVEKGGAFFAYLGPGEPPEFPNYDFHVPRRKHSRAVFHRRNYFLQANEGNYDPRTWVFCTLVDSEPPSRPELRRSNRRRRQRDVEPADIDPNESAPRSRGNVVRHSIFRTARRCGPQACASPISACRTSRCGTAGAATDRSGPTVPIDNETHWRWNFFVRRDAPLDAHHRVPSHLKKPGEYSIRITSRATVRTVHARPLDDEQNFTGMSNFNTHDAFATETPGPIQDRTKEHLATTDVAIAAARRQILSAIEDVRAGRDPLGLVRDPGANRFPDMLSFDVVADATIPNAEVVRRVVERETAMVV